MWKRKGENKNNGQKSGQWFRVTTDARARERESTMFVNASSIWTRPSEFFYPVEQGVPPPCGYNSLPTSPGNEDVVGEGVEEGGERKNGTSRNG